mmetsp:Transcript_31090/g.78040  ORF Transcript_31090/g.78040 Transcript_31090/m.78040 type:complete len:344 (-) Transcript_31090:770-1801(-)
MLMSSFLEEAASSTRKPSMCAHPTESFTDAVCVSINSNELHEVSSSTPSWKQHGLAAHRARAENATALSDRGRLLGCSPGASVPRRVRAVVLFATSCSRNARTSAPAASTAAFSSACRYRQMSASAGAPMRSTRLALAMDGRSGGARMPAGPSPPSSPSLEASRSRAAAGATPMTSCAPPPPAVSSTRVNFTSASTCFFLRESVRRTRERMRTDAGSTRTLSSSAPGRGSSTAVLSVRSSCAELAVGVEVGVAVGVAADTPSSGEENVTSPPVFSMENRKNTRRWLRQCRSGGGTPGAPGRSYATSTSGMAPQNRRRSMSRRPGRLVIFHFKKSRCMSWKEKE